MAKLSSLMSRIKEMKTILKRHVHLHTLIIQLIITLYQSLEYNTVHHNKASDIQKGISQGTVVVVYRGSSSAELYQSFTEGVGTEVFP